MVVKNYIPNLLEETFTSHHTAEPCCLIIFGATGDLTQRKLLPALYHLIREKLISENFYVLAFARREKSNEQFRKEMLEGLEAYSRIKPIDSQVWYHFSKNIYYHQASFESEDGFSSLKTVMEKLDQTHNTKGNRVFYLSTHSSHFIPIIEQLKKQGLTQEHHQNNGWARFIIEKPFGRDFNSAINLQTTISEFLEEKQIFRIDHYLGKETVQNLLVFRFTNSLFASVWNSQHIDHVQITVSEDIGIGSRGAFFEKEGALRDMIQNHLMQLLTLVAMEPPASLTADAIRDEKVKVLNSLKSFNEYSLATDTIRGQYTDGFINGSPVKAYLKEDNVDPQSRIETFVALKVFVNNWRWSGVPFYLRTGKRLPKRSSEIAITFKPVPDILYQKSLQNLEPNTLAIRIQPNEGISLKMNCKVPGQNKAIQSVKMNFSYKDYFGVTPPEAYERLIYDCILGDSTLFTRGDEAIASWKFLTPVINFWEQLKEPPYLYPAGSWGPQEAFSMLQQDGRKWRVL